MTDWPVHWPLAAVAVAAFLYARGGQLSSSPATPVKRWRGAAFYGGLAVVALAVDSPVDAYADTLFWVHMVQHVLLTMVAPPLLLLGRPWPRIMRPFAPSIRKPAARSVLAGATLAPARRVVRALAAPVAAFVLFNGTLLAWHVPALYDLTLRNGLVHDGEHALFFTTALLFWTHLLPSARPALGNGGRLVYGTAALGVSWLLAIVIGLASSPLYSAYAALPTRPGGLSALGDQQLAAGVMWVPASIPYCVVLVLAVLAWLDPAPRRRVRLKPGAVT